MPEFEPDDDRIQRLDPWLERVGAEEIRRFMPEQREGIKPSKSTITIYNINERLVAVIRIRKGGESNFDILAAPLARPKERLSVEALSDAYDQIILSANSALGLPPIDIQSLRPKKA